MSQSHYRALLSLGLPIVIGQIGVIVLGFADTLMIGHHSTTELAAASFVNNMFNLAIIFSTGFAYGLTPVVGSLFGRHKVSEVGRTLKNSLAANTVLAAIVCLVMTILYLNLDRMGQPDELIPHMRPYLWYCWFLCHSYYGSTDSNSSPMELPIPKYPCGYY